MLGPEQAGKSLPLNQPFVGTRPGGVDGVKELIGFPAAALDLVVDLGQRLLQIPFRTQTQAQHHGVAGRDLELIMNGCFCSRPLWVGALLALDNLPVEGVFHIRRTVGGAGAIHARHIGFIVREQECAA